MSEPGSNGQMDGERNVERFSQWVKETSDFAPYINQGTLSISRIAEDSGVKRGAFYTNRKIRDELVPQLVSRLEQKGLLKARINVPTTVVIHQSRVAPADKLVVKALQEQNDLLKQENAKLREELAKHKAVSEILNSTGRLPW
jgi:hypothetical protein